MFKNKKILLIAGGGTLGTHTGRELLRLGARVEVICPEEKVSDHANLRFYQSLATDEFLTKLFSKNHYDAIVNFIHYEDPTEYRRVYPMLRAACDQLVFLSSYRVYADEMHPITEDAPRLYDVLKDEEFLAQDTYAIPKSKCEDFLRAECADDPWTIVRPVISFSDRRLDLVLYCGKSTIHAAESGRTLILPESVRDLHAGLDWAGNSGKLIAHLLCKKAALGGTFNIYSGHGMTWGEVAEAYHDAIGLDVRWGSDEEYLDMFPTIRTDCQYARMWYYDRKFDRQIDASHVLEVTGLCASDFCSIRDGIAYEAEKIRAAR